MIWFLILLDKSRQLIIHQYDQHWNMISLDMYGRRYIHLKQNHIDFKPYGGGITGIV